MRSKQLRYGLVVFGLVASEAVFSARPTGDLYGAVAFFPDGAIWFSALLISWAFLMAGMFSGGKERKNLGPLVIGTVGAAVLMAANI